ncbi:MAG: TRAM domain-containing protein, partial [Verrucomicrobiota bacterium]
SIEQYEEVVARIRDRVPEAAIHTDIIVGFCGETEEQFMDTYRHLERVRADKVHLAKYSERPRTVATRNFDDDVPADEKERRRKMIDDLQKEITTEKMKRYQDRTVEILVDGRDEKSGRWRGRTPRAKLVYLDDDRELLGQTVDVHIERTGPWCLIGHAADRPAAPTPEPQPA